MKMTPPRPYAGLTGFGTHITESANAAGGPWNPLGQAAPYGSLASLVPFGTSAALVGSDSPGSAAGADAAGGAVVGGIDYAEDPPGYCKPSRGMGSGPGESLDDMTVCGLNGTAAGGNDAPPPGPKTRGRRPDCDTCPNTLSMTDYRQRSA